MTNLGFVLFQSQIVSFLPLVLIMVVFYFLMIVPQRKRQKQLAEMVSALKTGDKVITSSGIVGTVTSLKDDSLMLRTGQANIEIQRSAVSGLQPEAKETKAV